MPYSKEEYDFCINGLKSDDSDLRRESAEDLGYSEIDEAALELVKYLVDPDKGVRDAVANALKKLDFEPSALPIAQYLKNSQIDIRNYASDILLSMQDKAVDALLVLLKDPDHDARKFATDILGLIGLERSVDALIDTLNDSDPNVQVSVIEALGNIGCKKAVDPLIALAHLDHEHIAMILDALGKIGSEKTYDLVMEAINSEDAITVFAAIESLGHIGSTQHIPMLISKFNNSEEFFCAPLLAAILKILSSQKISVLNCIELQKIETIMLEAAFAEKEVVDLLSDNVLSISPNEQYDLNILLNFVSYLNKESKLKIISYIDKSYNNSHDAIIEKILADKDEWLLFKCYELIIKYQISGFESTILNSLREYDGIAKIGAIKAVAGLKIKTALNELLQIKEKSNDSDILKEISIAISQISDN